MFTKKISFCHSPPSLFFCCPTFSSAPFVHVSSLPPATLLLSCFLSANHATVLFKQFLFSCYHTIVRISAPHMSCLHVLPLTLSLFCTVVSEYWTEFWLCFGFFSLVGVALLYYTICSRVCFHVPLCSCFMSDYLNISSVVCNIYVLSSLCLVQFGASPPPYSFVHICSLC